MSERALPMQPVIVHSCAWRGRFVASRPLRPWIRVHIGSDRNSASIRARLWHSRVSLAFEVSQAEGVPEPATEQLAPIGWSPPLHMLSRTPTGHICKRSLVHLSVLSVELPSLTLAALLLLAISAGYSSTADFWLLLMSLLYEFPLSNATTSS